MEYRILKRHRTSFKLKRFINVYRNIYVFYKTIPHFSVYKNRAFNFEKLSIMEFSNGKIVN